MKRPAATLRHFRWLTLLVLAATLAAAAPPARQKIRIGIENDSPPLSFVDAKGKAIGFTPELLHAVSQASDLDFEITVSTWTHISNEFSAGRLDALANVVSTPERALTMDFTVGHAKVHLRSYAHIGKPIPRHTGDFAGKQVAVVEGSIIHKTVVMRGPWGATVHPYPSRQAALEAVVRGDCDFALLLLAGPKTDDLNLPIQTDFVDDLALTFHVAVHQGDTARLDQINEGLRVVLTNGTLDRIYAKWVGPTEPHPIRVTDLQPYFWPLFLSATFLTLVLIAQQWAIAVRRRAQTNAMARAEELATLMNASLSLIFIAHDLHCRRMTGNAAACAFMRMPADANISQDAMLAEGKKITYRDHEGRETPTEDLPIQKATRLGQAIKGAEMTIAFPDGTVRELYGNAAPLFDDNGQVRGGIGTFVDVTNRHAAEQKLRSSLIQMNEAQRVAHMGSWRLELATNQMIWSDELCRMSGLDPAKPVPPLAERQKLYLPESREKLMAGIAQIRQTGGSFSVEVEVLPLDHKQRCMLVTGDAELNAAGTVIALHGMAQDITEQKLAAGVLRANEQRFRLQAAALAATIDSVVITDSKGDIEWVNPAFTRITGYTPAEVMGKNPRILKSDEQSNDYYEEMWRTITSGHSWSGEFVNLRKDGSHFTEEVTITPVRVEGRDITHYVAVKQDITEKRSLEKQLIETQRLESIGLLASGIAHDLNNIIAPITLSIELLRAKYPGEQRTLEMVEQCARRGAEVVRQVLTFSRGMDGTRVPLRISRLVKEMGHLMSETLPRNIEFSSDVNAQEDTVRADHTQIHQVILNLGVNARDAMPQGGKLSINLTNETLDQTDLPKVASAPGKYLVIAVADTGTGIPPEVLPRIFEPFFTTKPRGVGTGLGLSTVHGIVRSHGGFIKVESEAGVGTLFKVYLPLVPQTAAANKLASATPFASGEGRLVLVADDEPSIRDSARLVLEASGYKVITAENGLQAVTLFRAHQHEVKHVVLDRMMPVMTGESAALIIHQLEPSLPIILTTGLLNAGVKSTVPEELKAAGITNVLGKPFTADQLLRRLAR